MKRKLIRGQAVLIGSISVAVFLMTIKLFAGVMSHSMAVLASALDSAMDIAVSALNLFAFRYASVPPDKEHTYGHGKVESLAGLFQSLLIGLSGFALVFESVRRLLFGSDLQQVPLAVSIMIFSLFVTGILIVVLRRAAKKNPSLILATESLHFTTDLLANGGIIAALFLVRLTGYVFWDLLLSIAIAFYVLKASWDILKRSIEELLDRSLSPGEIRDIKKVIHHHDVAIVGLHRFRSRKAAGKVFLDFHIVIEGENDFKRAHSLTESLVTAIQKRYPGADVTVHFDPQGEK